MTTKEDTPLESATEVGLQPPQQLQQPLPPTTPPATSVPETLEQQFRLLEGTKSIEHSLK